MKYFAAVLLLAAVVCADEWAVKTLPDLLAARTTCVAQLNVPEEALNKYKSWTFPDDDLTRSYVTCIFKEFGLFCDHEGFHVDRLLLQFKNDDKVEMQRTIDSCVAKTDDDTTNEKWVFRAFQCFTTQHLSLVRARLTKKD